MRVAVTGASGHVGRWTVNALETAGHDLIGLGRRPGSALPWLQVDLASETSVEALRAGLADVEAVVHLAGYVPEDTSATGSNDAAACLHANALGTAHLLHALAGAQRLRAVVYASTFEVYGLPLASPIAEEHPARPLGFYGATKLAAEHYVRLFGADRRLPAASLRLPAVYGPGDRLRRAVGNFVRGAAAGRPPEIHGAGNDRRDLVYVTDAAEAIVRALDAGADGLFNLGSGRGYSILELAQAVRAAAGLEAAPVHYPQRKPARDYVLDVSRARRFLGWNPRTRLEDGIAAQLAWVRGGG